MRKILFFISVCLASLGHTTVRGQRIPDGGMHKVHIDQPGLTADAEILPVKNPAHPGAGRWYYWFSSGRLYQTQGGFGGHLLHGVFHSFYDSGAMMESGSFAAGLKTGTWRSWNSDGTLKQTVSYQEGLRSGPFAVYDAEGKVRQEGRYRDDLLEGAVKYYTRSDSSSVTWYHRGRVTRHQPLLKRLNPFKKRNRADTTAIATPQQ
ncbi:hypothetical protein GWR56_13475 [Mucilaginibacter sp. 14171R-50]|uniref:toxin-antitoxin system YwqK family antitoxin n=1 Tax=Mucilaginibacter sp. 14171R-50 TaxID=2703789 RepID=UPI00138CCDC3|nr:hypothetical protein [Mucilaginibacter sp. 14171R-50]QHS56498.1 hypothetical protein GWR56_13475 [Mucilaginibacter sp. 14171R-50]